MLAVFVVKFLKKKVHVLENNEGLLERDFATYAPFFKRFKHRDGRQLTAGKGIDPDIDICYCLKRENNKNFNELLLSGKLLTTHYLLLTTYYLLPTTYYLLLTAGLLTTYYCLILLSGKLNLDGTVFIVDEVDDLVVSEAPSELHVVSSE